MRHRHITTRRAMSIIEVLLGLAIGAILLAAVGSALIAVIQSTRTNDSYAVARQAATNSLNLVLTKIRRGKEISFEPSSPPYTTIVTLDEGVWDTAINGYRLDTCVWTVITVDGETLKFGTRTQAQPNPVMSPVLHNVQSMAITAPLDRYSRFHDVTVQLTVAPRDVFSGKSVGSFAVSATTVCRSEGPATSPAP